MCLINIKGINLNMFDLGLYNKFLNNKTDAIFF